MKFTIDGRLPNLNDYLKAERQTIRHRGSFTTKGNDMKQENEQYVTMFIRRDLKGVKTDKKVFLIYKYFEPNKKRDLDNISAFAHKVIQDALVRNGTIQNDGWANIVGFQDFFYVDAKHPRIEVEIIEGGFA